MVSELLTSALWERILSTRTQCLCTVSFVLSLADSTHFQRYVLPFYTIAWNLFQLSSREEGAVTVLHIPKSSQVGGADINWIFYTFSMNFLVLFSRAHWVRREVRKQETVWREYRERKEMGAQGISWQKLPSYFLAEAALPALSELSLWRLGQVGGGLFWRGGSSWHAGRLKQSQPYMEISISQLTRPSAAATPLNLP